MKLGLHVIRLPSGRFGYVGSIPHALCQAIPADKSAVMGGRAFRAANGELVEWKAPAFDTEQDARTFAMDRGFEVES